jgi:Fe-S-cluster containining protein
MAKAKGKPARDVGPTLAEVVARSGLLDKIAMTTRSIISRSVAEADAQGRVMLRVVSCHDCTAPKACCNLTVAIYLYEALPIVARLVAEGRDTPALRGALRTAAEAMENRTRAEHAKTRTPCVFLDAAERCTVYTERPAACGLALVYSPAEACSDPSMPRVDAYTGSLQRELSPAVEEGVREELGLPRGNHRYLGVLPRMVLLALQAWSRPDYVKFLAQHAPAAAASLSRAVEAT